MKFPSLFGLGRWFQQRAPTPAESQTTDVIRDAIRLKKQIIAYRGNYFLVFCPHALASGAGGFHVLAFVIIGEMVDDEDFHSPTRWRWIPVSELTAVTQRQGFWFSAPRESRPQLQTARIELEAA